MMAAFTGEGNKANPIEMMEKSLKVSAMIIAPLS
jgi:hypothetical protein